MKGVDWKKQINHPFTDVMIVYVENPNKCIQKWKQIWKKTLLELIYEFIKSTGNRLTHTQNNCVYVN